MGPSREECWQRLSPGIQRRVHERVGTWLDWWATDQSGRVNAVVLGTRALVVVTPTVNAAGRPAYELVTVHLRESSFRSAPIHAPGMPPQPPTAADAPVLSADPDGWTRPSTRSCGCFRFAPRCCSRSRL